MSIDVRSILFCYSSLLNWVLDDRSDEWTKGFERNTLNEKLIFYLSINPV